MLASSTKKKRRLQNLPRLPPAPVVRMFLLAAVAVVGCVWALLRFYAHPHRPMLVPAPSSSEAPAPELVPME
jgi:hypothetical protein